MQKCMTLIQKDKEIGEYLHTTEVCNTYNMYILFVFVCLLTMAIAVSF